MGNIFAVDQLDLHRPVPRERSDRGRQARGLLHAVLRVAPGGDILANKIKKFLGIPIDGEVVSNSLRYLRETTNQATPAAAGN